MNSRSLTKKLKIFRNNSDILPTSLVVLLFVLDLTVFFYADNIWILIFWLGLVTLPKVCICSWNHHHQHLHTFYSSFLNRIIEFVYALHTGVTTNAWVLHHNLGHHLNYLDQTKDESAWKRKNGTIMGEWEYTFVNAVKAYFRAFRVSTRHPKYQKGFLLMGILIAASVFSLAYYNWLNTLFVFAIPMFFGYLVTVWHTYSHHAGLDTKDHYEASHNILHRWYNIMTGNLGYHTAHHIKPGLHWSQLPKYHSSISERIPKELFVRPPIPFKWFHNGDAV
jgi:fatty acid desaturase